MLRRRLRLALTTALLLAATACGGGDGTSPVRFEQPAATSKAPPSAPPAPKNKAEVQKRVTLAVLDLATFHEETAKPTDDNDDAWKLAATCRALPSDRQRTAQHERLWDGKTVWIRHYVVGYLKIPGRKLLGELRKTLSSCKSYEYSDGRAVTVLSSPAPALPEATEVVTYCERLKGENVVHQCTAVLARGNFVAQVDVADHNELKASQAMLARLAPLAAEALAKAA
jgi:hypothetical protein